MSVTVSGGLLHVPEWSIRVDQIKEMYDFAEDGYATMIWPMNPDRYGDRMGTIATRAQIIEALALYDQHLRIVAVYGSRNPSEGKCNG